MFLDDEIAGTITMGDGKQGSAGCLETNIFIWVLTVEFRHKKFFLSSSTFRFCFKFYLYVEGISMTAFANSFTFLKVHKRRPLVHMTLQQSSTEGSMQ